jgi:hypothetical protein
MDNLHFMKFIKNIIVLKGWELLKKAGPTGVEPATSGVTGRCSNQIELQPLLNKLLRIVIKNYEYRGRYWI